MHDDHSNKDAYASLRSCDSIEIVNAKNVNIQHSRMEFNQSPDNITENHLNQTISSNHSLNVLGDISALGMSTIQSLQNLQALQRYDVLEKLKLQVRGIKAGLRSDQNLTNLHSFENNSSLMLLRPQNTSFIVSDLSVKGTNPSSQHGCFFTAPDIPCIEDGLYD